MSSAARRMEAWAATPRMGDPSVITEEIRSGICEAAASAIVPPKLWPMR